MTRARATWVAAAVTILVYVGIAWLLRGVEIPADASSAQAPWIRPFRVLATFGFELATWTGTPHLAGQLLAAIVLGAVLGAIFSTIRHLLQ